MNVMATPTIVLHQWCISPFCVKVQKVLDLKQLPYRIEEYAGLRALKSKGLSAAGKLPVLDYDGERIADSSAIARFVDQRHPAPPLVPATLDAHLVHLLEDWADESLYWYQLWLRMFDDVALDRAVAAACEGRPRYERALFKQGMGRYRRSVVAQGLGRYPRETVLSNLRQHLAALEGRLAQNAWLVGAAPSVADIAVASQLEEMLRSGSVTHEITALPRLSAWLKRCEFPSARAA